MAATNPGEAAAMGLEALAKGLMTTAFYSQLGDKIDDALSAADWKEDEGVVIYGFGHFLDRGGAVHFKDVNARVLGTYKNKADADAAIARDHDASKMFAHYDGYFVKDFYHWLPPGEVNNPITTSMKAGAFVLTSGCTLL